MMGSIPDVVEAEHSRLNKALVPHTGVDAVPRLFPAAAAELTWPINNLASDPQVPGQRHAKVLD
jgi:hypothetical protein